MTITNKPHSDANPVRTCIAFDCMAWRWDVDFNDLMDRFPNADAVETREHQAQGHCGLAGHDR